jgi:pSer/pThr/pTyr-binding forkhead associated (FHA) protein
VSRRFVLRLSHHDLLLPPGTWRIGRAASCELRLDDPSVSRRHGSLRVEAEQVVVSDLGSRNGTRVNGLRVVTPTLLEVGDALAIGGVVLHLAEQEEEAFVGATTRPLPRLDAATTGGLDLLSAREREVFERLARGETQREAAEALGLSVKTVETYRARIGIKLGLRTRAALVRAALEAGVLHAARGGRD